jgi:hypothetical protein
MNLPAELERMRQSGESVERVVEVGSATLAVTEQRLLALTPDSDGANFRAIERPNVEAISTGARGTTAHLRRAIRPGILGVVLLGASQFVDLEGVAGATTPPGTDQLGLGGLFALLDLFLGLLALLDTVLLLGGVGLLCLALLLVGAYGYSRSTQLHVTVAGGDDLRVPLEGRSSSGTDPARTLERALGSLEPSPDDPATAAGEPQVETPLEQR